MEREHMRVHEENKTEAGKVRWVRWVWPDGPDNVGGPVGRRWGRPDEDGDGWTKMGTNPDSGNISRVYKLIFNRPSLIALGKLLSGQANGHVNVHKEIHF